MYLINLFILMMASIFRIRSITLGELAIPDTYCSRHSSSGYQCPKGMVCRALDLESNVSGFSGFSNFGEPPLMFGSYFCELNDSVTNFDSYLEKSLYDFW